MTARVISHLNLIIGFSSHGGGERKRNETRRESGRSRHLCVLSAMLIFVRAEGWLYTKRPLPRERAANPGNSTRSKMGGSEIGDRGFDEGTIFRKRWKLDGIFSTRFGRLSPGRDSIPSYYECPHLLFGYPHPL